MAYVVGNAGVIKDPFVLEELERLQAYLKGLETQIQTEKPDLPVPTNKGDPTNPDLTKPTPTLGQRWMSGPLLIGADGIGIMNSIPSYPVSMPAAISTDQHNYALPASTIILELDVEANIDLTGLNQPIRQRRIVGILNRGAFTLSIINQSTSSEAGNRFEWGTSGDAGEAILVPTGAIVWVYFDPETARWRLFGVPFVGWENLPPSIIPSTPFPPKTFWFESRISDGVMTMREIGEAPPTLRGGGVTLSNPVGWGATRSTGAVVNNDAGYYASSNQITAEMDPDWQVLILTGSSVADVLIWALMETAGSITGVIGGGGTAEGMGFRFLAGTDAGWVGVTRDGATQSVTGTVAAIAANTIYRLRVRKSGASVFFSVNGGTEVEQTLTLPQAATPLLWDCRIFTQIAGNKDLTFFRHWFKATVEPD